MSKQDTKLTIEQFTKQAAPFANSGAVNNDDMLDRILRLAELTPSDESLDVACGPGLLVCAFAPRVRHATGIDLTPAMLDQARQLQRQKSLANVTWIEGDVTSLPFPSESFSVVTSRYAFHHITDVRAALKEMVRVSRRWGRIILIDVSPTESKAAAFDTVERLRDPSHVRTLTEWDFRSLFAGEGILVGTVERLRLWGDLDSLLARSFPRKGDSERVRQAYEDALVEDVLDVSPRRNSDGEIHYSFPIVSLKAVKPH